MARDDTWSRLGIAPTRDEREIKRAYARRLREVRPEDDAEGFQALRAAYEAALGRAGPAHAPPLIRFEPAPPPPATEDVDAPAPSEPRPAPTRIVPGREEADDEADAEAPLDAAGDEEGAGPTVEEAPAPDPVAIAADAFFAAVSTAPVRRADDVLRELLARPALDMLDERERLEAAIAIRLADADPPRLWLALDTVEFFGWERDSRHLRARAPWAADAVLAAASSARALLAMREKAKDRSSAENFLLKKYSPGTFAQVAMSGRLVHAMRRLLAELRRDHPALLAHELDPKTVEWWARKTATTNLYWWHIGWFFAVFVVLRIADVLVVGEVNETAGQWIASAFLSGIAPLFVGFVVPRLFERRHLAERAALEHRVADDFARFRARLFSLPAFASGWMIAAPLALAAVPPLVHLAPGAAWVALPVLALLVAWIVLAGGLEWDRWFAVLVLVLPAIVATALWRALTPTNWLAAYTLAVLLQAFIVYGRAHVGTAVEAHFGAAWRRLVELGWLVPAAAALLAASLSRELPPLGAVSFDAGLLATGAWAGISVRHSGKHGAVLWFAGVVAAAAAFEQLLGLRFERAVLLGWVGSYVVLLAANRVAGPLLARIRRV